jgi:ABC-type uncharacterized transport system substrate-binding protein
VLLSDATPAYANVAAEIERRRPGAVDTVNLATDAVRAKALRARLAEPKPPTVIAIGLPAAKFARQLGAGRLVFCQVFNYEDAGLAGRGVRGVSATPPVREQFRYWKLLSPSLRRVGVVSGPALPALLAEARAAARDQHLELVHAPARSDRELLAAFKRLAPKVDGFWLLPDNRVLSREAVRDLLAYAKHASKQVLVFTPELLGLGALLSAEADPGDVAERVLVVAGSAPRRGGAPTVVPLTRARIRINATVAAWFNLTITPPLQGLVYAP